MLYIHPLITAEGKASYRDKIRQLLAISILLKLIKLAIEANTALTTNKFRIKSNADHI